MVQDQAGAQETTRRLGQAVRAARLAAGMTQSEAAEQAGMSLMTWGSVERATRHPTPITLARLDWVLGWDAETASQVMAGSEPPPPPAPPAPRAKQILQLLEEINHKLDRLLAGQPPAPPRTTQSTTPTVATTTENNAFATAITSWLQDLAQRTGRAVWSGTAAELLATLPGQDIPPEDKPQSWPTHPVSAATQLRQLQAAPQKQDILISGPVRRGRNRDRTWTIRLRQPIRPQPTSAKPRRTSRLPLSQQQERLLREIAQTGASLNQIAAILNISRESTRRRLEKLGLTDIWQQNHAQQLQRQARQRKLQRTRRTAEGVLRRADRSHQQPKFSQEQIFETLRQASATTKGPLTREKYEQLRQQQPADTPWPSGALILIRYGWREACAQAGVTSGHLPTRDYTSRWTDQQLISLAHDFADQQLAAGQPCSFNRFGDWLAQDPTRPSLATIRHRATGVSELFRQTTRQLLQQLDVSMQQPAGPAADPPSDSPVRPATI